MNARERGAALVVCLIILVLVTLMGLTTMKTSVLQEKMAGGNADKSLALQAAEMALKDAELHVKLYLNRESGFIANCAGVSSLCEAPDDGTVLADSVDWAGAGAALYGSATGAPAVSGVARQPRYFIEILSEMSAMPGNSAAAKKTGTPYRITAVGYGRQDSTRVVLQSMYYKP